jgi:hypothetical protein
LRSPEISMIGVTNKQTAADPAAGDSYAQKSEAPEAEGARALWPERPPERETS